MGQGDTRCQGLSPHAELVSSALCAFSPAPEEPLHLGRTWFLTSCLFGVTPDSAQGSLLTGLKGLYVVSGLNASQLHARQTPFPLLLQPHFWLFLVLTNSLTPCIAGKFLVLQVFEGISLLAFFPHHNSSVPFSQPRCCSGTQQTSSFQLLLMIIGMEDVFRPKSCQCPGVCGRELEDWVAEVQDSNQLGEALVFLISTAEVIIHESW